MTPDLMEAMGQEAVDFNRAFCEAGLDRHHIRYSTATDETVIYGMGAAFDGNLRRRDLEAERDLSADHDQLAGGERRGDRIEAAEAALYRVAEEGSGEGSVKTFAAATQLAVPLSIAMISAAVSRSRRVIRIRPSGCLGVSAAPPSTSGMT
mgnify:CR=1 FL=1